jgi:hypothetical protein
MCPGVPTQHLLLVRIGILGTHDDRGHFWGSGREYNTLLRLGVAGVGRERGAANSSNPETTFERAKETPGTLARILLMRAQRLGSAALGIIGKAAGPSVYINRTITLRPPAPGCFGSVVPGRTRNGCRDVASQVHSCPRAAGQARLCHHKPPHALQVLRTPRGNEIRGRAANSCWRGRFWPRQPRGRLYIPLMSRLTTDNERV